MDTFADEQLRYRIALSGFRGMTRQIAETLIELTGDVSAFFTLSHRELIQLTGCDGILFSEVERGKALRTAAEEVAFIRKNNITPLFFTDPDYPQRLLECEDAPLMLYYKGSESFLQARVVSIVGTRHATPYGKNFVDTLVRDLASAHPGTLIVSGLAYGIDIAAHRAAMHYGLPTVAVLAHGMNTIYPASHRHDAVEILSRGGLVTEYTSGQPIHRSYFLTRNRIIAGLADTVVVVESGAKGGSLVTASIANDYNRDVFALPGRVGDTASVGCNELIRRNKAALITSAQDLLEAMNWTPSPDTTPIQASLCSEKNWTLTDDEQKILQYLRHTGESQINRMAVDLGYTVAALSALLVELEFKNTIIACPGGIYRIAAI